MNNYNDTNYNDFKEKPPGYENYSEYTASSQRKCSPCPPEPKGGHGSSFTTARGFFTHTPVQKLDAGDIFQYDFKQTDNITEASGAITLPMYGSFLVMFQTTGGWLETIGEVYNVNSTLSGAFITGGGITLRNSSNNYNPYIGLTFIVDTNATQNVLRIRNGSSKSFNFGDTRLSIIQIA
ncbi:hypothetical protein P4414_27715 [Bacillus thuringiensis]|nr:hypothetical protein [Bacillus thuringiensis]